MVQDPLPRPLSDAERGAVSGLSAPLSASERGRGRGFAVLAVLILAACVTQNGPRTGPLPAVPAPGIVAAPAMVTVDTREYLGEITVGPLGVVLTKDGATQVPGGSVRVYRPGLGQSDGIEAKRVAQVVCANAGGAFNARVLGRFVASGAADGSWLFDGACT